MLIYPGVHGQRRGNMEGGKKYCKMLETVIEQWSIYIQYKASKRGSVSSHRKEELERQL